VGILDNCLDVYISGAVIRNSTGPAIVISFILAGIASLLSALCYAEFGARVPKAGSAVCLLMVVV
jgi:cationic amino acid transporter 4